MNYKSYKFWDVEDKRMYESHEIGFIDLFGGRVQINNEWKFFDEERYGDKVNCIPIQSTGLIDKNAKEIYDGSILKSQKGILWVVLQHEDRTWVASKLPSLNTEYISLKGLNPIWMEIVGNRQAGGI